MEEKRSSMSPGRNIRVRSRRTRGSQSLESGLGKEMHWRRRWIWHAGLPCQWENWYSRAGLLFSRWTKQVRG
jgi:hypothetical protein